MSKNKNFTHPDQFWKKLAIKEISKRKKSKESLEEIRKKFAPKKEPKEEEA